MVLNTALLLFIAFIPYPTGLLSDFPDGDASRAVILVYGSTLTLMAVMYALLWWYATNGQRLIAPETPQSALDASGRRYLILPPLYLGTTLVSLPLTGIGPGPFC